MLAYNLNKLILTNHPNSFINNSFSFYKYSKRTIKFYIRNRRTSKETQDFIGE